MSPSPPRKAPRPGTELPLGYPVCTCFLLLLFPPFEVWLLIRMPKGCLFNVSPALFGQVVPAAPLPAAQQTMARHRWAAQNGLRCAQIPRQGARVFVMVPCSLPRGGPPLSDLQTRAAPCSGPGKNSNTLGQKWLTPRRTRLRRRWGQTPSLRPMCAPGPAARRSCAPLHHSFQGAQAALSPTAPRYSLAAP